MKTGYLIANQSEEYLTHVEFESGKVSFMVWSSHPADSMSWKDFKDPQFIINAMKESGFKNLYVLQYIETETKLLITKPHQLQKGPEWLKVDGLAFP